MASLQRAGFKRRWLVLGLDGMRVSQDGPPLVFKGKPQGHLPF